MGKGEKVLKMARKHGIYSAERLADKLGVNLFSVDVGPGSRVEVWNGKWNRRLRTGSHISKYSR